MIPLLRIIRLSLHPLVAEDVVVIDDIDDERAGMLRAQNSSDRLAHIRFGGGHQQRRQRWNVKPLGRHGVCRNDNFLTLARFQIRLFHTTNIKPHTSAADIAVLYRIVQIR